LNSAPTAGKKITSDYFSPLGVCPKISIGLEVVGIAASRVHGIGIPDAVVIV
jgi:hypothetical protein